MTERCIAQDANPWAVWKAYRGECIERRIIPNTDDGHGKTKYEYRCFLSKGTHPVVYSLSQQGIRAQIGRIRNDLFPYDCRVCTHLIPDTPLHAEHCRYFGEGLCRMRWCVRFETRV